MCRDPDVAPRDIVGVIELDPALTLKVLRLCNSPFYGIPLKVTTLRGAVVYLGADAIVNYVLAGCVASLYGSKSRRAQDTGEGWRHAVGAAVCAQVVAGRSDAPLGPLAFTCGLLHDIGKVLFDASDADEKLPVPPGAERHGLTFLEAERAAFGFDHAEAGAALAKHWSLPEEIVESIRWHHDPVGASHHHRLVCLVHVGNVLSVSLGLGLGGDGLSGLLQPDALETLGVTVEELLAFGADVDAKIKAAIATFQTA